ncbi:MAG: putative cardiolipin synthase YbhO [Syntrophus sp. PtaU1.Bin208]|nr:MAG: putative cardiolipin synthase YbhO [Syntrophus sp. PtaU1.Bin208]
MLPSLENRTPSTAVTDTGDTKLGRAIAPLVAAHPGKSGIYPLADSHDAFAARVLLARDAERSLDVQYYIWRNDLSGTLLFEALHDAADRGVRVRMLLDDHGSFGIDGILATLDAHPNIEVRLFNPFAIRRPRWINYLTDFFRLNRRMHNKSFTADNQATIVGGRNVGDEYFGAAEGTLFVDLDVLAVGTVVRDVSAEFDAYWASGSSYPVDRLLPSADPVRLAQLESVAVRIEQDPVAADYMNALHDTSFLRELVEGRLALEWDVTQMVSDDPAKGLGLAAPEAILPEKLRRIIGEPEAEVVLVSAYFVPTAAGVNAMVSMAARGVAIRVLTNSLEATDVGAVHAGYAKWRRRLLKAGIVLYELRRLSPVRRKKQRVGSFGRSGMSLHAKTFSVDRSHIFIGSFNFDPRSANLNTEMGFVINSPLLAQRIAALCENRIAANSYQVSLSETGKLCWIEQRPREVLRHETEPGTTLWQRAGVHLLSLLPIEWLL